MGKQYNQYNLPPLIDRFMDNVSPEPMSGCWLWTGSVRNVKGYGSIRVDLVVQCAHRLSYKLFRGPIQHGLHVCHRCNVKACVNPDHLYLGTNAQNMADATRDGLRPRGERNGKTKFTEEDVRAIRNSPLGCVRLARQYNVTKVCIMGIRRRRTWKHVD